MKRELKIGAQLTNSDLHDYFQVATEGGMRRSLKNNCLLLISRTYDNDCPDIWDGQYYYFMGMGKQGDQDVHRAQNRTLLTATETGIATYLFLKNSPQAYVYLGPVTLAGEPLTEHCGQRRIIRFPLKPTVDLTAYLPAGQVMKK